MLDAARAAAGALRRFVLPACCRACGAPVDLDLLCDACRAELVPTVHALRLPAATGPAVAFFALPLDGPARALVHGLKFEGVFRAAEALAGPSVPVCRLIGAGACDVAVPVPLHTARQRERGYNQSALLTRALASALRVRQEPRALARRLATAPQTGLERAQRLRNVRSAFAPGQGAVSGRRVLLVDDVVTTGATLAAAARTLLDAGAASVTAFAPTGRPETG
jgi:ComF family protein